MFYKNEIIGRKEEKKILEKLLSSNKYELCAIYGRRRVGKTYLLKQYLKNNKDCCVFYFSGTKEKNKKRTILNSLRDQFEENLIELNLSYVEIKNNINLNFENFSDFFHALTIFYLQKKDTLLKDKKFVIILDEIAWLNVFKSNFLSDFSSFINTSVDSYGFKVFISGSSPSWIKKNILNNNKTLFNRKTQVIELKRFSINEIKEFLISKDIYLNNYELLKYYMFLGGIPYYFNFINPEMSFEDFISTYFIDPKGLFGKEFDFLFSSLFDDKENFYKEIVEILSTMSKKFDGMTIEEIIQELYRKRDELKDEINIDDKNSTEYKSFYGKIYNALNELIECDFIFTQNYLFKSSKDKRYLIKDPFCYLHLKMIKSLRNLGYNNSKLNLEQQIKIHFGLAFELFIALNIDLIKDKIGIKAVNTEIYGWQSSNVQIDFIIYRDDKVLTICEAKFYENKKYELNNNEKIDLLNKKDKLQEYLDNKFIHNVPLSTKVRQINFALITLNGTIKTKETASFNFYDVVLDDF